MDVGRGFLCHGFVIGNLCRLTKITWNGIGVSDKLGISGWTIHCSINLREMYIIWMVLVSTEFVTGRNPPILSSPNPKFSKSLEHVPILECIPRFSECTDPVRLEHTHLHNFLSFSLPVVHCNSTTIHKFYLSLLNDTNLPVPLGCARQNEQGGCMKWNSNMLSRINIFFGCLLGSWVTIFCKKYSKSRNRNKNMGTALRISKFKTGRGMHQKDTETEKKLR